MISLKNKVLDTIEEKEIEPKPEWKFTVHSWLLWASVGLSILFGALAFSVIIFFSVNGDWDVLARIPNRVSFIFFTLPYAWLIATIVALVFTEHQYRQTRDAYRHRYSLTIFGVFLATTALGFIFYYVGIGQMLDAQLERLPGYEQVINPRVGMWNMVQEGRLAGKIIEVLDEKEIVMMDSQRNIWLVTFEEGTEVPETLLTSGKRVRLLGRSLTKEEFKAKRILPWIAHEPDRLRIERLKFVPGMKE